LTECTTRRKAEFLFDTKRDDEAAVIVSYKKFNCSTQDLNILLRQKQGNQFGSPSREHTRARDVQAELAWNPSALTSMSECVE
jgi:hypothetical protein